MLDKLNGALEYIEQNLGEELNEHEMARRACCSVYHFKRMFSYLSGITFQEYLRKRRLTRAAFDLQQDHTAKVIDIAIKYGYNSPDSFTRAFQSLHGMTPTEARTKHCSLTAYPPMTFRLTIGGSVPMKCRVEKKDSFKIIGIHNRVIPVEMGEHPGINEVWRTTTPEKYSELKALNNVEPYGILHVDESGEGKPSRKQEWDYYLSVASTQSCPAHFTEHTIPALTWVIFEVMVPWEKEKWHRIYGEWFPTSGYEEVAGPKIQVGPDIQPGMEKQVFNHEKKAELWIPIKKVVY